MKLLDRTVVKADDEDLQASVRRALSRSGYSFEELEKQARSGRFESLKARLAWLAVGDLRGEVHP